MIGFTGQPLSIVVRALGYLALSISPTAATAAVQTGPNLVVIVADDLGWNAVGYHNPVFQTPHLDRLAESGVTLNRFYVAPMCSPTRAGFLTGRYPIRFGCARAVIPPYRDFGLPTTETTLAEQLGELGYQRRGVFGKWHLGHRRAKWHPLNQGFTKFVGHYNGAIDYFDLTREDVRDWHHDYTPADDQGYATDLIADAAVRFIRTAAAGAAPYFCYVPFNAPHSPFQAPQNALDRFKRLEDLPADQPRRARQRKTYAAMIARMDDGIGRILDAIQASGESDQTLVWFFSDNGGVSGIADNNAPLQGSKLTVYEGGIRVPACVRWPEKITAGRTSETPMGYIDLFPTLVAATGRDLPEAIAQRLDGVNVLPALTGSEPDPALPARPWFSYHGQPGPDREHLAVTVHGWKLIVQGPESTRLAQLNDGSRTVELYHLAEDPDERTDLSRQHADRVAQLGRLLIEHRALQPVESVPPYSQGREGFQPPPRWELNPAQSDRPVGRPSRQNR